MFLPTPTNSMINPSGSYNGYGAAAPVSAAPIDDSLAGQVDASLTDNYILNQPIMFYLGGIGLLVLFKVASEHPATDLDVSHLHVGAYDIAAVTVAACIGIASLKLAFNRWYVPGLSEFVNFV